MIRFTALVVAALLFKLLGGQLFTPLSFAIAGLAFFLRYFVGVEQRLQLERFLLQFGMLIYALSNQDPSYYEHIALAFCLAPTVGSPRRLRRMGRRGRGRCCCCSPTSPGRWRGRPVWT